MNVHAIFFPGKKEESVPALAKYSGAQRLVLDIDLMCADRERFASEGLYENTPYSGIHEALAELRSAGLTLCVASSKPHIYVNEILAHFELRTYFTAVFGSELDGTLSDKSDLLAYALAETGVAADDAIMIGDRKHDIIGALDNGIAPIGALYGYGSREELTQAGARHFARSPGELPSLVLSPRSFRTP